MVGADVHEVPSLFRQLLDALPDPVFALDHGGHAVYLNAPAARLLGRAPGDAPSRPVWDEASAAFGARFKALARRTLRAGTARRYEARVPGLDAWWEVHLSPAPPGLLVTCRDITARREGHLRRIAEASVTGLLRVVDGEIVEANDAFLHLLGHTREDLEAGLLRWRDLVPPELRPLVEQAEQGLRRSGVALPHEQTYLARDGRRVPVLVGAARLGEEDEHLVFVLDLSEPAPLKRAQAEREALLEQQSAERARYQAVLQQQPVGVLVVDAASGRVEFANRRLEELLGVEVQPGAPAAVLHHLEGAGGRPLDEQALLGEALRQGRAVVDQDLRLVRADGTQRLVWASAAPVHNRLGETVAAVLTLDESEERLERLLPTLSRQEGPPEPPPGPVTREAFVRLLGRQLTALGHTPLDGRLVALLLISPGPLTLSEAAQRLHATKGALSRTVNGLLAKGDVLVARDPSSREFHLELTGGVYLRDLLDKRALSLSLAALGYALLRDQPDLDPLVARRVREMADIRTRNALHLGRLLAARQEAQHQVRASHLANNWDAVPPRDER